jgi:UDP-GlcNAc:undecaprenyl-phosphate GlcNAc-1-phosphate transferase
MITSCSTLCEAVSLQRDGRLVSDTMPFAAIAFATACVVAFAATPFTSRLALSRGILDRPDPNPNSHKRHAQSVPCLGGLAIGGAFLVSVFLFPLLDAAGVVGELTPARDDEQRMMVIGACLAVGLGGVGLLDDMFSLSRLLRLIAQVVAAVAAWSVGFQVLFTPWEPANLLITVVWIVGITNAFNLLDNMDGLTAGLAGLGALAFAAMSAIEGLVFLAVASAAISGASFGFLAHNRHPARAFMGDAGSMLLGFLLALIGIELRFDNLVEVTFLVPVVALGLPIFDTTLVILSRIRHGKRPFRGGTDHVSHRLILMGLPVKVAVGLLYWVGVCLAWLAVVISQSTVQTGWMLLSFVIAVAIFFGIILWRVPVYGGES